MLRKFVLELSSRLSTKRFPRNLGAQQRFHLSSSRKASSSGKNGIPGSNPVVKPDASKVTPPPPPLPPVGKPDGSEEIISEAGNVSLEVVQKPEDNTVISAQSISVDRESNMDSASPKDPDTEKSYEAGVDREAEVLDSLLKEYNLEGNDTESNGSSSSGEQLIKETEACANSIVGHKDGYMNEDGKLVLEFLGAIHVAENRQAHLDAHVFAEELQALKDKYENELRVLRARELMRIEEAAILDKVHEGRNHEVRELVKNVGLEVHSLKRVRIDGFRLPSDLGLGNHAELKQS